MAKIESDQAYAVPWVRTQHSVFRLDEPTFDIRDIAHALAYTCRFNGHLNSFYSVAQHSMVVCTLMDDLSLGNPLEGLLHDGTEAYLSDVPAPFKQCLPDWRAIDARLEISLRKTFNLPDKKSDGCKTADWYALFMEAHMLLPGGGEDFEDPLGLRPKALSLLEGPGIYRAHYGTAHTRSFNDVKLGFIDCYDYWDRHAR